MSDLECPYCGAPGASDGTHTIYMCGTTDRGQAPECREDLRRHHKDESHE